MKIIKLIYNIFVATPMFILFSLLGVNVALLLFIINGTNPFTYVRDTVRSMLTLYLEVSDNYIQPVSKSNHIRNKKLNIKHDA